MDTSTAVPTTGRFFNGMEQTEAATRAEGVIEMDQWDTPIPRVTTADPISADLERNGDASFAYIGSGMTQSSGVLLFLLLEF